MDRIYVNLKRFRGVNYNGLIIIISLVFALITLCYVLLHNPYQKLHEQIFQTAYNIRAYYSDHPGYWKLNTESAVDDKLVSKELLKHTEYDFKIGIGINGDTALPSDSVFDIVLSGVNKSTCIGLVEAKVGKKQLLSLQKITVINIQPKQFLFVLFIQTDFPKIIGYGINRLHSLRNRFLGITVMHNGVFTQQIFIREILTDTVNRICLRI